MYFSKLQNVFLQINRFIVHPNLGGCMEVSNQQGCRLSSPATQAAASITGTLLGFIASPQLPGVERHSS